MSWMLNFPDGKPGEGGPEAVRQRNAAIVAHLEFLNRPAPRPVDYLASHIYWDQAKNCCVMCGESKTHICMERLICRGSHQMVLPFV